MNNQKGVISILVLMLVFVLVVVVVGGAIYFDSTNSWDKLGFQTTPVEESVDEVLDSGTEEERQEEEIVFVPYQSSDQLYQLQIPDSWTGEERAGAAIFYSYNPVEGQPEQRAKVEVGRVANPDMLTTTEWLTEQEIDVSTAQPAIFDNITGSMFVQDNTGVGSGDIKSVIYMLVNDQVLVVTSESFGGTRDVAVQFFNAILNSWQWLGEVTSPDQLADESASEEVDTGGEEAGLESLNGGAADDGEPVADNIDEGTSGGEDGGEAPSEEGQE